jgi:crotonobetainyl-CoA:carnitine CoA-transferase CaiB-like acyl-CoA transferase
MNQLPNGGPLAGVRVTCIAVYVPALSAAQRLRASGAEVVAVEPPQGDPLETLAPSWYRRLHEGVTTRRLDLKSPAGAREVAELLAATDVLFIALRPSAAKRLGLDWATLHATHPALCVVAITGHAPPHAEIPGHDLTYQAARGLVAPPAMPRTVLADLAGAERAAYAATTLLFARERSGLGGHHDVSLEEALAPFAEPLELGVTGSAGPLGGALPSYGMYAARDGWIAVAALEPHFWRRLCDALGADGAELDREALTQAFAERSVAHWVAWAHERDLPLAAVT